MPWGDGTGPWCFGPMRGRRAGFCACYPVPGFMNPILGRGFWGWGRSRGRGFFLQRILSLPSTLLCICTISNALLPRYLSRTYQRRGKSLLEDMVKSLEAELKEIKARLAELAKEK